jgi:hypothetical protein
MDLSIPGHETHVGRIAERLHVTSAEVGPIDALPTGTREPN